MFLSARPDNTTVRTLLFIRGYYIRENRHFKEYLRVECALIAYPFNLAMMVEPPATLSFSFTASTAVDGIVMSMREPNRMRP